jgi:hypothetical protein
MRKRAGRVFLHTTGVHEAGHAVAACAYRIPFVRVVLEPNPKPKVCKNSGMLDRWLGGYVKCVDRKARKYQVLPDGSIVERTTTNSRTFRKCFEDHVVMMLAGREATKLLLSYDGDGHRQDYSDARKIIRRWLLPGADIRTCNSIIDNLRPRAKRLLRNRMPEIKIVTQALDRHGTLSAKQVRAIVKGWAELRRHMAAAERKAVAKH